MTYTVIIENAGANYSAYVPDLPGCITTGTTRDETMRNMREAIEFHLEGMREDSEPIPAPTTTATVISGLTRRWASFDTVLGSIWPISL